MIDTSKLQQIANEIRIEYIKRSYTTKSTHIGSAFSSTEVMVYLYFKFLNISSQLKHDKSRDRFILSKGHCSLLLNIMLNRNSLMSNEVLDSYSVNGGALEHHPRRNLDHGIELTTGSLGLGLSVGTGFAYAGKQDGLNYKTVVLMGDGEINEGSVWETAMFAAQHKLNKLIAIVDYNKLQALGSTKNIIDLEPLSEKWKSFGWKTYRIDGHNYDDIEKAFSSIVSCNSTSPSVIIADTIKGKGVSFMENNLLWHYRCPDETEYKAALKELNY